MFLSSYKPGIDTKHDAKATICREKVALSGVLIADCSSYKHWTRIVNESLRWNHTYGMYLFLQQECTYQWSAVIPLPGVWWGTGGGTSSHTWGHNPACVPFPYILNIMKDLSGLGQSQLSINHLGKILTANPPPFSNICPRYERVGHTIDRCITRTVYWRTAKW